MKKLVSVLLAAFLAVGCLVGCGSGNNGNNGSNQSASKDGSDIADDMTSKDGKYQVALVTDIGQLKDKSFNESSWNGVKLYAYNNDKSYKYYQPANGNEATDDDRFNAMKAAVDGGAEVIVCPGFSQAAALTKAAATYPDVKFIFLDGWVLTDENDKPFTNIAAVSYQEEQCGYFAGYAAVKEGYEKLGFTGGGGGTNPACCRYLYGYLQGANDAAKEMDKNIEIKYTWLYGGSFSASQELQTLVDGWYTNGTEIVFSCGGSICQSVFAAAEANNGMTIGVDVDQAGDSKTVLTSALKGLTASVTKMCGIFYDGKWDTVGGQCSNLGAADDATGLPTAAASWRFKKFTVEEYNALFDKVVKGEVKIDADYGTFNQKFSNATVSEVK